MSEAQSGALARTEGSMLVVFAIGRLAPVGPRWLAEGSVGVGVAVLAKRFEIGFLDRTGDHVASAGPFAQVDQPATLRAERKIRLSAQDDLATGGTTQAADFVSGHGTILTGGRSYVVGRRLRWLARVPGLPPTTTDRRLEQL